MNIVVDFLTLLAFAVAALAGYLIYKAHKDHATLKAEAQQSFGQFTNAFNVLHSRLQTLEGKASTPPPPPAPPAVTSTTSNSAPLIIPANPGQS